MDRLVTCEDQTQSPTETMGITVTLFIDIAEHMSAIIVKSSHTLLSLCWSPTATRTGGKVAILIFMLLIARTTANDQSSSYASHVPVRSCFSGPQLPYDLLNYHQQLGVASKVAYMKRSYSPHAEKSRFLKREL